MTTADNIELTISLRADLAHTIKRYAEEEDKTPEQFIVETLWALRAERANQHLAMIHEGWQLRMLRLGLFSEEDLFRYLESP